MASQYRPVPDVLNAMVSNIRGILRGEIRLAVTEIKEETTKAARASAMLGIGLVLGLYALGLLLLTGVYALATAMEPWLAALLITLAVAVPSVILIVTARKRMKNVNVKPEKTITSIKENAEWAKHQIKS
jgi:uncharacterized membrane protein YqjE